MKAGFSAMRESGEEGRCVSLIVEGPPGMDRYLGVAGGRSLSVSICERREPESRSERGNGEQSR